MRGTYLFLITAQRLQGSGTSNSWLWQSPERLWAQGVSSRGHDTLCFSPASFSRPNDCVRHGGLRSAGEGQGFPFDCCPSPEWQAPAHPLAASFDTPPPLSQSKIWMLRVYVWLISTALLLASWVLACQAPYQSVALNGLPTQSLPWYIRGQAQGPSQCESQRPSDRPKQTSALVPGAASSFLRCDRRASYTKPLCTQKQDGCFFSLSENFMKKFEHQRSW